MFFILLRTPFLVFHPSQLNWGWRKRRRKKRRKKYRGVVGSPPSNSDDEGGGGRGKGKRRSFFFLFLSWHGAPTMPPPLPPPFPNRPVWGRGKPPLPPSAPGQPKKGSPGSQSAHPHSSPSLSPRPSVGQGVLHGFLLCTTQFKERAPLRREGRREGAAAALFGLLVAWRTPPSPLCITSGG